MLKKFFALTSSVLFALSVVMLGSPVSAATIFTAKNCGTNGFVGVSSSTKSKLSHSHFYTLSNGTVITRHSPGYTTKFNSISNVVQANIKITNNSPEALASWSTSCFYL